MKLQITIGFVAAVLLAVVVHSFLHRPVEIKHPPLILGHGGSGIRSAYHLNSLESIHRAFAYPIDGIELDVQITADTVLVAFHDSTLEINTNCKGRISEMTLENLRACKQSTWFNETSISTVEEIIDSVDGNMIFSLDLKQTFVKPERLRRSYIQQLASLIQTYPRHQFLFESPDIQILNEIRTESQSANLFLLTEDVDIAVETARSNGLTGLSVNLNAITLHDMEKIKNQNLQIMLWGTGSVLSNRDALNLEPDIIQTDDIESIMKLLKLN